MYRKSFIFIHYGLSYWKPTFNCMQKFFTWLARESLTCPEYFNTENQSSNVLGYFIFQIHCNLYLGCKNKCPRTNLYPVHHEIVNTNKIWFTVPVYQGG